MAWDLELLLGSTQTGYITSRSHTRQTIHRIYARRVYATLINAPRPIQANSSRRGSRLPHLFHRAETSSVGGRDEESSG